MILLINNNKPFQKIIDEYRKRGHEFLFDVFNSSKCLEELSGISEMLNAQHDEVCIRLMKTFA